MLVGRKCKVGSKTDRSRDEFTFYEGVIASEPQSCEPDEFRILVLVDGKLITADTYYMYDIEEIK